MTKAATSTREEVAPSEDPANSESAISPLWQTCLARAIVAQGRRPEAAQMIEPVVNQWRADRA